MQTEVDQKQTVFVVEKDSGLRESLGVLFRAVGQPVELFATGTALLSRLRGENSGCILMNYMTPGCDGLRVMDSLRQQGIMLPIIFMTAHGDINLAVSAMKAGARDFIEKPWAKGELLRAVEGAMRAEAIHRDTSRARQHAVEIVDAFTPRELEVFDELVTGASTKMIARTLDLSPRTVEFHRSNVLEKSGSTSVASLVRLAFAAGRIAV